MIPKANQAGKWRLILDLSSPKGASVNDTIPSELCTLLYIIKDDAVVKIMELGKGCCLAKLDVEHAYRNIPVHPDDWSLIAMRWKKKIYIDTILPFGLYSAPKIFLAVVDATQARDVSVTSLLERFLDNWKGRLQGMRTEFAED